MDLNWPVFFIVMGVSMASSSVVVRISHPGGLHGVAKTTNTCIILLGLVIVAVTSLTQ